MMKISKFSKSKVISFLSSYKESSLRIKININRDHDISYLRILEEQLSQLIHLQELEIIVPSNVILTEDGYLCITNAINNLKQLVKLSINIGEQCYLSDSEFMLFKSAIQNIANLHTVSLTIKSKNNLTSQVCQDFVDSLRYLSHLRKLSLDFFGHQKSSINEGNLQFWRGIQYLSNLKKLELGINFDIFGDDDLRNLYEHISSLKELTHFSIIPIIHPGSLQYIDEIILYIGQMVQLRSLKVEMPEVEILQNAQQRQSLLDNLSNLKHLEKLQIQQLQNQLLIHNFTEYLALLGGLPKLKRISLVPSHHEAISKQEVVLLSQNLLKLKNLTYLEFNFANLRVRLFNEFMVDLSDLFRQTANLSTLILNFNTKAKMSEYGCNLLGDSFCFLQNLKKLEINYKCDTSNQTSLIHNLRRLINLENLKFQIWNEEFYETPLYDSISHLNKLENLSVLRDILKNQIDYFTEIQSLSCALKQLKALKNFECNLKITGQTEKELEMFTNAFEELNQLEKLHINFQTNSILVSNISSNYWIFKQMTGLKKLSIAFKNQFVNFFNAPYLNTNSCQYQLEDVKLTFYDQVGGLFFISLMDSLSSNFTNLKKLEINVELTSITKYIKEFGIACSKFTNLEKLTIDDSYSGNLSFYFKGIMNMKRLRLLKFYTAFSFVTDKDKHKLIKALRNLTNLERLSISFYQTKKTIQNLESELNMIIKQLKKLKHVSVDISTSFQGERQLEMINSITLKNQSISQQQFLNGTSDVKQELDCCVDKQIDLNQTSINNIDKEIISNNLNIIQPTELRLNLSQNQNNDSQQFYILDQLEDINLSCLSEIEIFQKGIDEEEEKEIQLSINLFSKFDQLKNLRSLYFDLKKVIFTEQQILQFASNLKTFIFMDYFNIVIGRTQDYYAALFDEIKQLINLSSLMIETDMTEICAISLGNSLVSLKNLEYHTLHCREKSSFAKKGLISILNGLRTSRTMISMCLILKTTTKILCDDGESGCSLVVIDFYQHMKILKEIYLDVRVQECLQSSKEIIDLYASFLSPLPQSLKSIELISNAENPFDQQMLDNILFSIHNIKTLNEAIIQIYIQNNIKIKIPNQCAHLCNKYPTKTLSIKAQVGNFILNINQNIVIKLSNVNSFENLDLAFFEELDEDAVIKLIIYESKMLSCVKKLNVKTVIIRMKKIGNEEDINAFCSFLTLMQNNIQLSMELSFNESLNEKYPDQIAQSLVKLVNLKVLNITLATNSILKFKSLLNSMYQVLMNLNYLSTFCLSTDVTLEAKKLIPLIKRQMKRMVHVSSWFDISIAFNDITFP